VVYLQAWPGPFRVGVLGWRDHPSKGGRHGMCVDFGAGRPSNRRRVGIRADHALPKEMSCRTQ
jgi:hypothetical protein